MKSGKGAGTCQHLSLHPFIVRAGKRTLLTIVGQNVLDSLGSCMPLNKEEKSIMGIMSSLQGKYGRRANIMTGLPFAHSSPAVGE